MPSRSRMITVAAILVLLSSAFLLHLRLEKASPLAKALGSLASQEQGIDGVSNQPSNGNDPWLVVSSTDMATEDHDWACPSNLRWLDELHLRYPLKYARRDIVVKPIVGLERASVTKVQERLFPDFQTIAEPMAVNAASKYCKHPLTLKIPATPLTPADASHVVFGMSTSLDRLEDSIPYFQRWLAHTNGRLIAMVTGPQETAPDTKSMERLEILMNDLGIRTALVKPIGKQDTMAERYFSLVKLLYEHRDEDTRWISFFDDDTFVTSMPLLLSMLEKYDCSKPQYIGAVSEEWWTVGRYGMMGMGGAGIFLSVPLVEVLNRNYQTCKEESHATAGDMRIFQCVELHISTKLTHVPGLHQIDLHGDRSGLFESGRQLLTVHHWKEGWWDEGGMRLNDSKPISWFPMASMHLVASVCETCFLQRWQFGDDMVLSNGYSIATYPTGQLGKFPKDMGLEKVEHTWETPAVIEGSNNQGFDHYLGPLRPSLELDVDKIQYRFLDAVAAEGGVRQYYVRLGVDEELDELVELFWTRDQPSEASIP